MGLAANWIGSPAGKLPLPDDMAMNDACGPCSGSSYRGVSSPESFCSAYMPITVTSGGVATIAGTLDYTLFNNEQSLNNGGTTVEFGGLSGKPTSQDTNMWGGALDMNNRVYVVTGVRMSLGKPFTAADLNATHVVPALTDGDLSALRALVAENTGVYIVRGSQDCEHPLGVVDSYRLGPEDDNTAGNRQAQPSYLSDPLSFIASETGRAENCIVRVECKRKSSVVLPAYATESTLYVPLRVFLTIVRPQGNVTKVCPTPAPSTSGMRR